MGRGRPGPATVCNSVAWEMNEPCRDRCFVNESHCCSGVLVVVAGFFLMSMIPGMRAGCCSLLGC